MPYLQPFQITGFHSCDRATGIRVLQGDDTLQPSINKWDWLADGVYFWEQNPERALDYAIECASGQQYNRTRIKTPFVIGAVIELGNCLNLVEPRSLGIVKEAYEGLLKNLTKNEAPVPVNDGPKRMLDCAVIQYIHTVRKLIGQPEFDTIRSPFHEAQLLYPSANFSARMHIEICVRNHDMITGYFLPRPVTVYNPSLRTSTKPENGH